MQFESASLFVVYVLSRGLDSAAQQGIVAYVVVTYGKKSDIQVDMAIDRQVVAA